MHTLYVITLVAGWTYGGFTEDPASNPRPTDTVVNPGKPISPEVRPGPRSPVGPEPHAVVPDQVPAYCFEKCVVGDSFYRPIGEEAWLHQWITTIHNPTHYARQSYPVFNQQSCPNGRCSR